MKKQPLRARIDTGDHPLLAPEDNVIRSERTKGPNNPFLTNLRGIGPPIKGDVYIPRIAASMWTNKNITAFPNSQQPPEMTVLHPKPAQHQDNTLFPHVDLTPQHRLAELPTLQRDVQRGVGPLIHRSTVIKKHVVDYLLPHIALDEQRTSTIIREPGNKTHTFPINKGNPTDKAPKPDVPEPGRKPPRRKLRSVPPDDSGFPRSNKLPPKDLNPSIPPDDSGFPRSNKRPPQNKKKATDLPEPSVNRQRVVAGVAPKRPPSPPPPKRPPVERTIRSSYAKRNFFPKPKPAIKKVEQEREKPPPAPPPNQHDYEELRELKAVKKKLDDINRSRAKPKPKNKPLPNLVEKEPEGPPPPPASHQTVKALEPSRQGKDPFLHVDPSPNRNPLDAEAPQIAHPKIPRPLRLNPPKRKQREEDELDLNRRPPPPSGVGFRELERPKVPPPKRKAEPIKKRTRIVQKEEEVPSPPPTSPPPESRKRKKPEKGINLRKIVKVVGSSHSLARFDEASREYDREKKRYKVPSEKEEESEEQLEDRIKRGFESSQKIKERERQMKKEKERQLQIQAEKEKRKRKNQRELESQVEKAEKELKEAQEELEHYAKQAEELQEKDELSKLDQERLETKRRKKENKHAALREYERELELEKEREKEDEEEAERIANRNEIQGLEKREKDKAKLENLREFKKDLINKEIEKWTANLSGSQEKAYTDILSWVERLPKDIQRDFGKVLAKEGPKKFFDKVITFNKALAKDARESNRARKKAASQAEKAEQLRQNLIERLRNVREKGKEKEGEKEYEYEYEGEEKPRAREVIKNRGKEKKKKRN